MEHKLVSELRTRGLPGRETNTAMAHMSSAVAASKGPAIPMKKENAGFSKVNWGHTKPLVTGPQFLVSGLVDQVLGGMREDNFRASHQ